MATEWHYNTGGERHGPVSVMQLKQLARNGELQPSDLLWKKGLADWVPASKVKGLVPEQTEPPPLPDTLVDHNLLARAENNHLQAIFCLNECQAHLQVYGTHLVDKANDGLEFVDAAVQDFPNSSSYLNTKALLLSDGLGRHQETLAVLRKAFELEPDSILIKQNINKIEQLLKGCLSVVLVGICSASAFIMLLVLFV